ncbi:HlyC/CorC family transporter [Aliikangiella coralliicola]|uniref:Magnesium and cobalt efflux protein CorC n=1 Tax=Aliikangiella coralliicola TaxID=2592383 RepID=A0A545UED5_9GAMM|nr:transporter associated domain-containing protein [Aliikangiella coralliicola]TQV87837.1 CBS domain-containing protein [Aliikangiella coralliicola]
MSDDKPPSRSWFEKIVYLFQDTPQDREQLVEILKVAEENALINPELLSMMLGVMHISELQARDIMIPRPEMVVIDEEMDFSSMLSTVVESGHSRFPVIGDNRDDIEGILLAKDLLHFSSQSEADPVSRFNLKDYLRPAVIIPESKRLDTLLKEFRANRNHMAIVVDEYGGVAGLVTIEDVLEQIVGEIEDEFDIDDEEDNIHKIADNRYNVKARTEIEEFNEYFSCELSNEEYDTIGGILMQAFGHMPARGESITIDNLKFEIVSADTRRIKLLRISFVESQSLAKVSE